MNPDIAGGASVQAPVIRTSFFARSALLMAAIVLLSFPLTYYVPVVTRSGEFDTLHHLHALAFFGWIGLYVWQTQLVVHGKIARHREIGLAGFALTGAVSVLGIWMAQRAAQRRSDTMERPFEFTWYNLVDIAMFTVLMIAAILLVTRHKEWHRRFVFVAALCLVAPSATRWTLKVPGVDPFLLDIAVYSIVYPFMVALAVHDRRTFGRIHPATLSSLALMVPLHLSGAAIARSDWWNTLAPALIGAP